MRHSVYCLVRNVKALTIKEETISGGGSGGDADGDGSGTLQYLFNSTTYNFYDRDGHHDTA